MIPIVTPAEMGEIDRAAPEQVDELIARAGAAALPAALDLLGGTYGRRVVVLAGKGNNGRDGRDLAGRLQRRGVRVEVRDVTSASSSARSTVASIGAGCDLVIDAAYGTGFRGRYRAPEIGGVPVLAIDIPSGVDGLTGEAAERVLDADRTVTFAALKPGLLLVPGRDHAGDVELADIGLDVSSARAHLVEDADIAEWVPDRPSEGHKWQRAVWVVGGSPGLEGAAVLTSSAAIRVGAGYVRWSSPSAMPSSAKPIDIVGTELPFEGWAREVLADADRFGALTLGNGLGLDPVHTAEVRALVGELSMPVVVDADALSHLGTEAYRYTGASTILTPHDGEFARLTGSPPGVDRFGSVRDLAASLGAIVLLKGATTIVAAPDGRALVSVSGDARLGTLGTGDVLAGIIGAFCAMGVEPFLAAAAAAHVHGRAAEGGRVHGFAASDLVDLLPPTLDDLLGVD